MLLYAVSVLVVSQSCSEIPEGLLNNPVQCYISLYSIHVLQYKLQIFPYIFYCNINCFMILLKYTLRSYIYYVTTVYSHLVFDLYECRICLSHSTEINTSTEPCTIHTPHMLSNIQFLMHFGHTAGFIYFVTLLTNSEITRQYI
jgi:hypothetical protein